ncbi:MAG: tetratricopeptide repeat protein, partial [Actinomycetota bacterium]
VLTGPRGFGRARRSAAGAAIALGLGVALFAAGALIPAGFDRPSVDRDAKTYAISALENIRQARADGDPSHYAEARALLARSLELRPTDNYEASVGQAALANASHDFPASVEWSRRAIALRPAAASSYGLLGDALFELGRYQAADRAYQQMIDRRPDLASYVRASYALQYQGRTQRALHAMRLALESAGPVGESPAWIRHQLGDIYFGTGDLRRAARSNRIGIEVAPGYAPPTVGLAEVFSARGRLGAATAILERAVADLPSIEYLLKLAELYDATGRDERARTAYAAVDSKIVEYRRAGVLPDVDFILFYADRKLHLDRTLAEVREMYKVRPTGAVADALGWTLHALGRDAEALSFARRAAAAAPSDALLDLHAGVIAHAVGKTGMARDLLMEAEKMSWTLPPTKVIELRRLLTRLP